MHYETSANVTYTSGEERDGLVNSPEGRDINSLATDSSLGTNTGRVLTGTSVNDSVNENLEET